MEQHSKWISSSSSNPNIQAKQLAPVGTWSTFSKLPEDEKAKIFNAMRGACIVAGLMENR